ncbi:DUF2489 domain-containing protein [Alteromonas lipolytica]|uniref:DUF2489 domain-containing protein n=1 Tax=Alteromonas lipolytica TaxID=1856405 RepID=A0A1E8FAC9_9ALTE|nr:DUF2489 domain-containing protein [Alteromonas lipolytica]OFI32869.1 hypothetical protein BFC17_00920 [Alteromonas lipolytica]GGF64595.1 hypothetical protein GCM10011338_16250 [Alteromonas lipolytica]
MLWIILVSVGLLIIAALGVYAGKLVFQLQQQNARQKAAREQRLVVMFESIHTIARAMQQQQCNVSEGTIRICRLLKALPEEAKDYAEQYPAIHTLFTEVSGFAILEDRKALSKSQRHAEDKAREALEEQHESTVLKELPAIIAYCEQRYPHFANSQTLL